MATAKAMEETPRIDLDTKFIPGTRRLIAFRTHLFDDFIRHDGEGAGRRQEAGGERSQGYEPCEATRRQRGVLCIHKS